MKRLITIVVLAAGLVCGTMRAEIPAEVLDVLAKTAQTMENIDEGVSMDIIGSVRMFVFSVKLNIHLCSQGDKSLMNMSSTVLGKQITAISGCDGELSWDYTATPGEPDTLVISHEVKQAENEYTPDYDTYEEYFDAGIKQKKGRYEITFTNPKSEDSPEKTVMVIDAKTYQIISMQIKESVATINLDFRNIRFGSIDDSVFVLDRSAFPTAVVIEK